MSEFDYKESQVKFPLGRYIGIAVVGILAVVGIWLLFASTVTVGTGKIGVMTRFGHVTGEEIGEGFHWKNPLDKANIYDIKVQKIEAQATAASKDAQDVNATLVVNYRLEPGRISEIHQKIGPGYQANVMDNAIQEVFKASTAKYDAIQLITERPAVKASAYETLKERLGKYGIVIQDLSLTNFTFSKQFSDAIEQKQVAQQNAERAQFNLQQAQLDAQAQQAQSATLSDNYLKKLQLDNQAEAIKKWDGQVPKYSANGSGGAVFNIPLQ